MSDTVIDSCCLINLCAVGRLTEVLPLLGVSWHIPPLVKEEALFLRTEEENGSPGTERVDLQPAIDVGVLALCAPEPGTETELYVELAAALDDAEAMALAIAKCRSWLFATDDRMAIRHATALAVSVITTPELMKRWADATSAAPDELCVALLRIQNRARFTPSPKFPLYDWWSRNAAV